MNYFYLMDCNSSLGQCCGDYGLVNILSILKRSFSIIQLVVPIILLLMVSIQLVMLMVNPEMKNGNKFIFNKFIAAIIIFLLPVIVNVFFSIMPETVKVKSCWDQAENSAGFNSGNQNTTGYYSSIKNK